MLTVIVMTCRDGTETLSVAFMSSEKRASWEESFIETKLKLRGNFFLKKQLLTRSFIN